jgi:hypothetical protein
MSTSEQPTLADVSRAITVFQSALVAALQAAFRQLVPAFEALRPMVEYYERHPELLAALSEPVPESCHCLCQFMHGSLGICEGDVEPGLTITRYSPTVGTVHIPMCGSCHAAATVAA